MLKEKEAEKAKLLEVNQSPEKEINLSREELVSMETKKFMNFNKIKDKVEQL